MSTAPIRVLVVDDHNILRSGVIGIVNAQADMEVVAEASDGVAAVQAALRDRPDVTLLDLRMPKLEGVEALERIRAEWPEARVILLTTYDTDEDIERGLRAGARAFLLKDVHAQDLVQCIRDVHAGRTSFSPEIASKLANRLTRVQLTRRELEVLRLVADGKANKEIASALFITESTVKLHINSLFQKLGVTSRTEAMKAAIERGLIRLR